MADLLLMRERSRRLLTSMPKKLSKVGRMASVEKVTGKDGICRWASGA